MPYYYSDPTRETDTYALPDVEVFEVEVFDIYCEDCDDTYTVMAPRGYSPREVHACCDGCARRAPHAGHDFITPRAGHAWAYRYGFPGCLPDSDTFGPFDTEDAALADARESAGE